MANPPGQVRIIAGKWRGRKLKVPSIKDLRPSADVVRETLFNWLREDISGSNCLDLYAGSGSLGFEAASRGAASVTLVDRHPVIIKQLQNTVQTLEAERQIEVVHSKAASYLNNLQQQFRIVFLDPPFNGEELDKICNILMTSNALDANALVYIESGNRAEPLPIPASWHIIRQKTVGRVLSTLINTSKS